MGVKVGRLLTCDRCGSSVFEEERKAKGEEEYSQNERFFYREKGWEADDSYRPKTVYLRKKALCPSCSELKRQLDREFWDYEKEEE